MVISKNIIEGLKTTFKDDSRFIIEIGDDKSYFKLLLKKLPGNPYVHFEYSAEGYVGLHLESATKDSSPYLCNLRASVIEELKERVGKDGIVYDDKNGSWYGHFYLKNRSTQKLQTIKKYFYKLIEIFEPIILRNMKLDTQLKELLLSNHNLILTGAPGTGKTYLAKQIAARMILGKEYNEEVEKDPFFKEHCGFVQFHPSYDYTDFVEGLRPMEDENGDMGFERKDGIFKAFCKKALQNFLDSKKSAEELNAEDNFRTAYQNFTGAVVEGKETKIDLKRGGYREIVGLSINNNILLKSSGERSTVISFDRIKKLSAVYKSADELDKIGNISTAVRDVIGGCDDSAYWATLHHLYKEYYKETTTKKSKVEEEYFVFIIDEINRGDISKILGELFFSIDPGYRGEKGRVQTQYQNLIDKGDDIYDEGFYVPENVYIIGTMNDIDRSVESMDFAMRRRFAWKEITAEDQMDMLGDPQKEEDKKKMNRLRNLNSAIEGIEGLSKAYHIGPAYFLKLNMYKDMYKDEEGAWNSLWENHIEGVLREYLRGKENVDTELMPKLKAAYENPKTITT